MNKNKLAEIEEKLKNNSKDYWKFKSYKDVGDQVIISEDMGGGKGIIKELLIEDNQIIAKVVMDNKEENTFDWKYLNSL